jgi:hypothetical protein
MIKIILLNNKNKIALLIKIKIILLLVKIKIIIILLIKIIIIVKKNNIKKVKKIKLFKVLICRNMEGMILIIINANKMQVINKVLNILMMGLLIKIKIIE